MLMMMIANNYFFERKTRKETNFFTVKLGFCVNEVLKRESSFSLKLDKELAG
jgi:hypothetical protein